MTKVCIFSLPSLLWNPYIRAVFAFHRDAGHYNVVWSDSQSELEPVVLQTLAGLECNPDKLYLQQEVGVDAANIVSSNISQTQGLENVVMVYETSWEVFDLWTTVWGFPAILVLGDGLFLTTMEQS